MAHLQTHDSTFCNASTHIHQHHSFPPTTFRHRLSQPFRATRRMNEVRVPNWMAYTEQRVTKNSILVFLTVHETLMEVCPDGMTWVITGARWGAAKEEDKSHMTKSCQLGTTSWQWKLTESEEEGWPPSQKQCSIRASRRAFNYAQGKNGHRDNFRCYRRFTTKVDHQTTSKIFRSCLMIDLGRETNGNNEICLGVRFALCITMKTLILTMICAVRWVTDVH